MGRLFKTWAGQGCRAIICVGGYENGSRVSSNYVMPLKVIWAVTYLVNSEFNLLFKKKNSRV